MGLLLSPEAFLADYKVEKPLLIDARSPSEYLHARIPGAVNIPLLNDEQRAIVGTTFKKQGREAAVLKGFDLVGPGFGDMVREVKSKTDHRELFIYCWRGGLRSNIISWVLSTAGFSTTLLKGGYKNYRSWVLKEIHKPRNYMVLGGRTGSGKTEILNSLRKHAHVVDLEALAHHKGSAFGHLGQEPQPGNEQYENLLAKHLSEIPAGETVWLENESRNIGSVKIPDIIYQAIRDAMTVEVFLDMDSRIKRILNEYGQFPVDGLSEATKKVRKRLGEVRLREVLDDLQNGRLEAWAHKMIQYYDKMYDFGMGQRSESSVITVDVSPLSDAGVAARKILAALPALKTVRS
jgi:tRNA 2-selenouridine synthase